jgi:hypothetical protein
MMRGEKRSMRARTVRSHDGLRSGHIGGWVALVAEVLPIPAHIWQRIQAFLKEGKTGRVVLNVHVGVVQDASFEERIYREERAKIA